jgi:hypothetical protein
MAKGVRADTKPHDEAWLKDRVKEILKKHEVMYDMPAASMYSKTGVHDFVCCARGRYLSIETKAEGKKATPLQKRFGRKVQKAGGIALLIYEHNYKVLDKFFDYLYAGKLKPDYRGSNWDDNASKK